MAPRAVARAATGEALAILPQRAVRWGEVALDRLTGERLSQHAVVQSEEAEASSQQALAVARRQQATALELRAAMSLIHLWQ